MSEQKEYLTYAEAAELAGVVRRTIWKWAHETKRIQAYLVAGKPRIKRSELEAFLKPIAKVEA